MTDSVIALRSIVEATGDESTRSLGPNGVIIFASVRTNYLRNFDTVRIVPLAISALSPHDGWLCGTGDRSSDYGTTCCIRDSVTNRPKQLPDSIQTYIPPCLSAFWFVLSHVRSINFPNTMMLQVTVFNTCM